MIEWQALISTNIERIAYQAELEVLLIEFVSGFIYMYSEVSPSLVRGLLEAPSHGQYFANHIRGSYFGIKIFDPSVAPSLTEEQLVAQLEESIKKYMTKRSSGPTL